MFEWLNRRECGFKLEQIAEEKLRCLGCDIIERNFSSKLGEIDIILKDGDILVFLEVRYRKSNNFGGASSTVDSKKQAKLIRTANYYLQLNKLELQNNTSRINYHLPPTNQLALFE